MDHMARVDLKSPLDLNKSLCIDLWKQEKRKKQNGFVQKLYHPSGNMALTSQKKSHRVMLPN